MDVYVDTCRTFDDDFSELKIGEFFDNVTLLDIDSNKINLSDCDGSYRFISYIFTRCPMPNMCPAVIMKTNYLVNSFSDYRNNFEMSKRIYSTY